MLHDPFHINISQGVAIVVVHELHLAVLHCVKVYCSVSPVCCSVLQCVAVSCSTLQQVAVRCSVLQCVAVCCSELQ